MDISSETPLKLRIAFNGPHEVDPYYMSAEMGLSKRDNRKLHKLVPSDQVLDVLSGREEQLVVKGPAADLCLKGLARFAYQELRDLANPYVIGSAAHVEEIKEITDMLAEAEAVRQQGADLLHLSNMHDYLPSQPA